MSLTPHKWLLRIAVVALALAVSYGIDGLLDTAISRLNDRLTDGMLRTQSHRTVATSPHIVHIDANFYYNRSDHALIIRQLADLGASVQAVDYIFTGRSNPEEDRLLMEALRMSRNALLGVKFESISALPASDRRASIPHPSPFPPLDSPEEIHFPSGQNPTLPSTELAEASAGTGLLDLPRDVGDAPRRLPVLVHWNGGLYPSLAFLALCRYLNIPPDGIRIGPGHSVTLTLHPKNPEVTPPVLKIPLDAEGLMHLNFIGLPLDIPHISYGDLVAARDDHEKTAHLKSMISGRIALISEVVEPAYRIPGFAPDRRVSSGAIHAAVIHNILTQSALRQLPGWEMFLIEAFLGAALLGLFARTNPYGFGLGVILLGMTLGIAAWVMIVFFHQAVYLVRPLIFLLLTSGTGLLTMSVERAMELSRAQRARRLAERELEIGRQIQADFFPTDMPDPQGYELVHHFQAARHVSGDFYDAFWLDNHPARLGVVVADVCDKGVGAALFMALIRTLIRVLSGEINVLKDDHSPKSDQRPRELLRAVLRAINDYMAVTHSHAGMFVTLFYGILQPETGDFHFTNAGHEPPLLISEAGHVKALQPTSPAVGLDVEIPFEVRQITLVPGDTLVMFTDGITEAMNRSGDFFTRKKLEEVLAPPGRSAAEISERIRTALRQHMNGQPASDDVTLLVLRRSAI